MEKVILVDENDNQIGIEEKLKAHQNGGKLHRAFSIFVFDSKGRLLIQKRAKEKYHSALLWTNTCCSHPRPGELLESAAHRRLKEEMGFDCPLEEKFSFIYKIDFERGFSEYEFDHLFIGRFDGKPNPSKKEALAWKWVDIKELKKDIKESSQNYTYWFKLSLNKALEYNFSLW